VGSDFGELEADLARARAELAVEPDNPDRIIWVARRLGYLWRMNEAVDVLTSGIRRFPDHAPLYRHRGHRYISLRRFDDAIADLEKAAQLIEGKPDEVEPDGMPNARGIPLTTTGFNVWYHLALARYLKGEYEVSLAAWRETMKHNRKLDDNLVAVTDWMFMTLCRLGRGSEATALLEPIRADMAIIENAAYHRRLLLYKGLIKPDELLNLDRASELDLATLGYGLGFWYQQQGDVEKARDIWQRVLDGPYWPAFGFIAAEVELVRDTKLHRR
jgi:tetratricopeptide (TPR) repeat protein